MSPSMVFGFGVVSLAIVVVPGPSVLFAISRAMVGGRRQALLTVLGNATGLFVQVVLVALGVGLLVTGSGSAYTVLKLAGAAYLIWLGLNAIGHRGASSAVLAGKAPEDLTAPLRDGFVVGISNPKSIVFLATLLPQFIEPAAGSAAAQMVLLGAVFCVLAVVCDSAWALLAAHARHWLSHDRRRLTWMSVAGGLVMIGLGLLLAGAGR